MAFTFFFRDINTLEHGVQYLVNSAPAKSKIKIWDAGCASGQEPYSLAIILAEKMGQFAFKNVTIYASDIDTSDIFEEIIKNGIYQKEQLNRIPSDLLDKYFISEKQKSNYQLIEKLRQKVKYKKHNLLSLNPFEENFSLIVCKNVLLHFTETERISVINMFYDVLEDEGILMIEQTQKLPEEVAHLFQKVSDNSQIYQKINN